MSPNEKIQTALDSLVRPFQNFARLETSSGILLLVCALAGLAWANSPVSDEYFALWETKITIGPEGIALSKTLLHWINDGLMAVFFFVVGLEIKRELFAGELASLRKAALPIAAAIGGMAMPSILYFVFNSGLESVRGWAIPAATDIAFALGILTLLGNRVPIGVKVFLTALAIVDDLGAVLVIALFYTAEISWFALIVGLGCWGILIVLSRGGVRNPWIYGIIGFIIWVAFIKSGVHATVAGVLVAMTIPWQPALDPPTFLATCRSYLDEFEASGMSNDRVAETQQAWVLALEEACEKVQSPLITMEHSLHPWVAYFIMPLFAFANAGVNISDGIPQAFFDPVGLGILVGLVIGKQVGIFGFAWLAVKTGIAALPDGVSWRHIYGAAWLGGIGFTMSLFIASLAFGESQFLDYSKIAILAAALIAGAGGWIVLRKSASRNVSPQPRRI